MDMVFSVHVVEVGVRVYMRMYGLIYPAYDARDVSSVCLVAQHARLVSLLSCLCLESRVSRCLSKLGSCARSARLERQTSGSRAPPPSPSAAHARAVAEDFHGRLSWCWLSDKGDMPRFSLHRLGCSLPWTRPPAFMCPCPP